jgi:hypothetical protein
MAAAAVLLVGVTSTATYLVTVRRVTSRSVRVATVAPAALRDSAKSVAAVAPSATEGAAAAPESGSTVGQRGKSAPRPSNPTPAVALASNSSKPTAEQVYASEIARLHTIVERRRAQLDPVTVSVIERNLRVIDDAIAQCKLALAKDPASRFLIESLNNALETKVELLRTATMLPARS